MIKIIRIIIIKIKIIITIIRMIIIIKLPYSTEQGYSCKLDDHDIFNTTESH